MTTTLTDAQLAATYGDMLLTVVARAIRHGIETGQPLSISSMAFPPPLQELRATFVTLKNNGELRGCIGSIMAHQPLVENVAFNAYQAAFHDVRFPPADMALWPSLTGSISILSPAEPIFANSEAEIVEAMRPGFDGIIFSAGSQRSVLLPQVWEVLPEPRAFLAALKTKAGLPENAWPAGVRIERFTSTSTPDAILSLFS